MSKVNVGGRIDLEISRLEDTTDLKGLTRLMYLYFACHFPAELRQARVLGTVLALPEKVLMRLVRVALRQDEDKRTNRALIRAGKYPAEHNQITYDLEIAKKGWGTHF